MSLQRMLTMRGGKIIIAGKAASGKNFLQQKYAEAGFKPCVSYTTRPMREGEVNGIDYYFVSEDEITQIELLEWVEFNGWIYGCSVDQFEAADVIIMTPSGIAQLPNSIRNRCLVIYLDIEEHVRLDRLWKREMPGDTMIRRMAADDKDFKDFTNYDYRITKTL